ncbi:MAG: CinA family protein [Faecousia sp.]
MTKLCCEVLKRLEGKTLATAESCTGGMIGAMLTSVPGASRAYKGGIISYWSQVKQSLLGVSGEDLDRLGPVSMQVAGSMADGARKALQADLAISVTGLAGPDGDEFGCPVGTVFVGFSNGKKTAVKQCAFSGSREEIRTQAARAALEWLMENL